MSRISWLPRFTTCKYKKGKHPCGQCNVGHHQNCRPRLDDLACSCECGKAKEHREGIAVMYDLLRKKDPQVSYRKAVREYKETMLIRHTDY